MVHLFGAIAMLLGLFLPLTGANPALAGPEDTTPRQAQAQNALPSGITQVVAIGDFQGQLGCADWDPNCGPSSLNNAGGIWSGMVGLTPGSYQVQFAVADSSGGQFTFGSGGQDGGAIGFTVGEGQAGAFFRYNSHTNEIQAEGIDALYTVQTDLGSFIPTPSGGTLDILVESQGGSTNVQLLAGGAPVGEPQQASLSPGWTRISLDVNGNVVNAEGLTYGTLTVQRLDADGNPAGGGCYQLRDGDLVNQACADGSGNAVMTFPEGVEPGGYTIVEVQAPSGQEPLDDQSVDLQGGDQVITLQPEAAEVIDQPTEEPTGEPTDEPIDEPTDEPVDDGIPSPFVVQIQDEQGNPIPGACWQLIQDGSVVQEGCDRAEWGDTNPGNGRTGFDSVPPGTYILHQSEGPDGASIADDREITISGDGSPVDEQVVVPVAEQPTEEPTDEPVAEEPTDEPVTEEPTDEPVDDGFPSPFVVQITDQLGNPIPGACWQLIQDGNVVLEDCDRAEQGDTNPENGRTGFDSVPPGTYTLHQSEGPEGSTFADDREVTISGDGNPVEELITVESAAAPTEEPTEQPTEEPTEQATEQPTDAVTEIGNLQVDLYAPDGTLVGGACWQLIQDDNVVKQACDIDDGIDRFPFNGKVGLYEVPVGTYTLHMSTVPEGYEQVPDGDVDITTSDALLEVTIQPAGAAVTEEATEEPTEEPTEEATEEATQPDGPPGAVVVTLQDDQGNLVGGACFELVNPDGDVVAESCDLPGPQDDFPNNGRTGIYGVPPGDYSLRQVGTVEGYEPVDPVDVTIEPNAQTDETLTAQAIAADQPTEDVTEEATEEVTEEPAEESLVPGETTGLMVDASGIDLGGEQLCIELGSNGGIGMSDPPFACDNGDNDQDPREGIIVLAGVEPGTYAFFITSGPDELQDAAWPNVTIEPGEVTTVPLQQEEEQPGALRLTVVDDEGEPVDQEGACVTVVGETDSICDNADGDSSNEQGEILIEDLAPGEYDVTQDSAPDGFEPGDDLQGVQVDEGGETDEAIGVLQSTGEIQVIAFNADGQLVGGACWAILSGDTEIATQCDDDTNGGSADDGFATFSDIAAGDYMLRLTQPPPGFEQIDDQPISIVAGENEPVEVTLPSTPGSVIVAITADGQPLDGACVGLVDVVTVCDNQEGDNDPTAGVIRIDDVAPGQYQAAINNYPAGYDDPGLRDVDVLAGEETPVEFALVSSAGSVRAVITAAGQPVEGACLGLVDLVTVCDNQEGDTDDEVGAIQIDGVAPGDYQAAISNTPAGYEDPDIVAVTVVANETAPLKWDLLPLAGSLTAAITADGEALDGACVGLVDLVTVCDNQEGDENPAPGSIQIIGIPPGEYQAAINNYPAGYDDPGVQDVTVASGEDATLTFALVTSTGSVSATITDVDAGEPVGGACLGIVDVTTVCDNQAGDTNEEIGVIQIDGLVPGDYQAAINNYPGGYDDPGVRDVTIVANEVAALEFELVTSPPEVAGLRMLIRTADESPVAGGCVVLSQENVVVVGPVCDNGTGDTDTADGVILLEDVPVGSYSASLTSESTAGIPGYQSSDTPSVTVAAGVDNQGVIVVVIETAPATGSLELIVRNNATNARLGGACFDLSGTGGPIAICDNGAGDLNPQAGVLQLVDLPAGDYTLVMSTTPEGYTTAAERTVTVEPGGDSSYEIRLDALPVDSTLTVFKVDPDDEPLGNSCFALRQGSTTIASQCDSTDASANDGTLVFNDVPAGTYMLVETRSPSNGYSLASPVSVTIVAGLDREVTVVNHPKPGRVIVTKVNANDSTDILPNACFALEGERTYGPFCDGDDGVTDGRVIFANVVSGGYTLVETSPPPGFIAADDQDFTLVPGATRNFQVANRPAPPPAETGDLVITKVNADGDRLAGSCFRLYEGNSALTAQVCDGADGSNDGLITFQDVPAGTWTLRETVTPSTSYQFAELRDVTIEDDEVARETVENTLKPGRLQVNKTNTDGRPLQGACFDLQEDAGGARCTDAYGVVVFGNLEPGAYTLVETQAPYGYQPAANVTGIQVNPGQTRVVNVTNSLVPPPANTGSVQVQKFYCPAGEEGEGTSFFGGAQGSQQLARTAGCERGNAAFTLTGDNGSGGPGAFQTGTDGQYQVTLAEGIYRLSETDPILEENPTVRVRVNRGQMTTVIVINYIAPPEPDPITVNASKYTCPPSFNGTRYEDFMEGCAEDEQLTNTVTIRIQGSVTAKGVTGDGGERGRTTFSDLTPGTYTIFEERPFGIPTDYLFCGFQNSAESQWKAVNGSLTVKLDYGQTLTCTFHNIPEVLTEDTGTILVRKFVCEIKNPPKGYDWEEECGLSHQNASFSLALYNAELQDYDEPVIVQANPDGFVRFTHLPPGSYQLREVDGAWCHAESNSVNAQGDVVVTANTLSEVWIYNCVEPTEPPNTGSGDAATNPPPADVPIGGEGTGEGPTEMPSVALLPLVAAGAWFANRRHAA